MGNVMSEEANVEAEEEEKPKGGKGPLLGLVLSLALGGGGFFAAYGGFLPFLGSSGSNDEAAPEIMVATLPTEFVPIDRMIISLGSAADARHLNFGAALEVEPMYLEEVQNLMPRILDILNTYLRAVEEKDIETPSAMTRLRAQMLRRVNIVTGEGRVKDLLITEFVLN